MKYTNYCIIFIMTIITIFFIFKNNNMIIENYPQLAKRRNLAKEKQERIHTYAEKFIQRKLRNDRKF